MDGNDTGELLKECSSGVKMGIASIDDILDSVRSRSMSETLERSKHAHEAFAREAHSLLIACGEHSQEPPPAVRGMAKLKTGLKMAFSPGDGTAAGLIIDGCNMGVKSMNMYLNRYSAADERARELSRKIISEETQLADSMTKYLI